MTGTGQLSWLEPLPRKLFFFFFKLGFHKGRATGSTQELGRTSQAIHGLQLVQKPLYCHLTPVSQWRRGI